jgi:hypothetical protein
VAEKWQIIWTLYEVIEHFKGNELSIIAFILETFSSNNSIETTTSDKNGKIKLSGNINFVDVDKFY